jgi:predicted histidine transporter YuiF (NhaC family)
MELLTNPVIVSVGVLYILCLKKINVLLALLVAALTAGICAGVPIKTVMDTFIRGMGNNAETSLSYILLGTFAAAMVHTGFSAAFAQGVTKIIGQKKGWFFLVLTCVAMSSQNILPVHIAFIPMLIPPLLPLMNRLQIDRRLIACILSFGLVAPYISIPSGFGLIFQKLIIDNLQQNGIVTTYAENRHCFTLLGFSMAIGLLIAVFVSYRKPRVYQEKQLSTVQASTESVNKRQMAVLVVATLGTFIIQLTTGSLPLGALTGLGILFLFRGVSRNELDQLTHKGIFMMGFIAFVMLAAAGFADVLKETKSVERLVNDLLPLLPENKAVSAFLILLVGLVITLGIGSSFSTIPIVSTIFVPLCVKLNFSVSEIIITMTAAAALGDAGAPVSETALGTTSGLNVDGQHDHIRDTCVPTFLHYNTALFLCALLAIVFGWV